MRVCPVSQRKHDFRAVLTNKNGSTEDVNREFFTSNALLRVEIGNIISGDFYLILSDEQGKKLATEKLSRGLEKDIKPTQPFYNDKFNLTTAKIGENFRSIATSINYKKAVHSSIRKYFPLLVIRFF